MARRAGVIARENADGTVSYQARWYDAYGKRCSQTFKTEAAAKAAVRHRQVEVDNVRSGKARPRSEKKLFEVAPDWLARRPPARRKDDAGRLKHHILPALGELRLAEINPTVLLGFVRKLEAKTAARVGQKNGKPLRPSTIKNVLVLLCKMLGDLGFPTRVKYTVPTSGYAWIQRSEDVGRFLAACKPDWFRIAAALAVFAGLRKGEVAGLRRDAIDFDRALLRVDRSYDGTVKSKHLRWAPVPPALGKLLRPWLLAHPGELVVTQDGEPIDEGTGLHGYARRACKRAGIVSVNFHQLRHTAASHLAQRVPLPLVGAVLGHADPKTTARYAHLDTESVARDARLHLTFDAPSGTVSQFSGSGTGAPREQSTEPKPEAVKSPAIS